MKKFIFAVLLSLPIFLSAGQYAGIHGGTDLRNLTNQSNSGQKVGFKVGGVWGYDFGNQVRTEVEVSYSEGHKRTQYSDKAEDQLAFKRLASHHEWSYMANIAYDIGQLKIWNLTPYFGAGVGYVQMVEHTKIQYEAKTDSEKRRDHGFAYQGIAGVKYLVSEGVTMNAQYCYHIPGPHIKNHSVTVGVVKAF